jgi:hypothetical protein
MKHMLATVGLGLLALTATQTVRAQDAQKVPPFIQETYPGQAIKAAVVERKEVMRGRHRCANQGGDRGGRSRAQMEHGAERFGL